MFSLTGGRHRPVKPCECRVAAAESVTNVQSHGGTAQITHGRPAGCWSERLLELKRHNKLLLITDPHISIINNYKPIT